MGNGEVMERLWSYLRCFSKMTKEMRPAHRIDVLTHGLVYYGIRKKDTLDKICIVHHFTSATLIASISFKVVYLLKKTST